MRYVLLFVLIVLVAGLGRSANGQFRPRPYVPISDQVTAEIDRAIQQVMNDAEQLLRQNKFGPAVAKLQSVLDRSEDYFLVKEFKPESEGSSISVRSHALRMLAELPAAGRYAYELHVGTTARDLLKHALTTNDLDELSRVASNYQMTSAGFEALQILAGMALDHNRPIETALLCETMLNHPRATDAIRDTLLLESAYGWYLAGDTARAVELLHELKSISKSAAWKIGGRGISPLKDPDNARDWLKAQFGTPPRSPVPVVPSWNLPRGGLTSNESATTAYPIGGEAWTVSPLKHTHFPMDDETNRKWIADFDEMTHQVEQSMRDTSRLAQPAAIPLIVGDVVIHRTLNELTAVSLSTGRLVWRTSVSDAMLSWLFQSSSATADNLPTASLLTFWGYLRFKLFRDQSTNLLTSDEQNVYSLEESDSQFAFFLPRNRTRFASIPEPANKLCAFELSSGRLMWEVGGTNGSPPAELSGAFFLGPPLPYQGRLYCLAESKNEIRLLSIVSEANSARLDWSQPLVAINRRQFGTIRRWAGSIPAISDGIVVCPTSDGTVIGFDLIQHQLKWGYAYESSSNRNSQESGEDYDEELYRWLDGGPLIANGCAIVTPRDSSELHCISLIDGQRIWKQPRETGLYVACVDDDRVIVVRRSEVMAYSLKDGSPAWTEAIEIPEPSGRGVRVGSQYLLPLSTGEIALLDLPVGRIVARSRLTDHRIPGNLAIGSGTIVTRGIHAVDGFHSLNEIESQIHQSLAKNANDSHALALRGELRLHREQEDDAIRDLRQSIKIDSQARVRRILAETLLGRLKHDPKQLLEFTEELESIIDDPRQSIEFLRLSAKSLYEMGTPVAAIKQLFRIMSIARVTDELISNAPDHFISIEQSVRADLLKIYSSATLTQKAEIATAFETAFQQARSGADHEHRVARFVKLTIGHPAADAILMQLVESKDESLDEMSKSRLLERLSQSDDKEIAGQAVADMIARYLAEVSPRDALPLLETLERDFATIVCRSGKTGKELASEWRSRDDLRRSTTQQFQWPEVPIEHNRIDEETHLLTLPVEIVSRVGSFFRGWSFETEVTDKQLIARDENLKEVWRAPLVNFSDELRYQPSQIHIRGRRLVFSSRMEFAVLEATNLYKSPEILFEKSLRSNSYVPHRAYNSLPERRQLRTGNRYQLAGDVQGLFGFLLGISDEAVFFQLDKRLYAADPETGDILWYRAEPRFGDLPGAVDKLLTLQTPDNGAILLRTLDGEIVQRHAGNPDDNRIWFHGTRRLSFRRIVADEQMIFEMRDFDRDHIVWQVQHPLGSVENVIEDEELAVLEPSGKLIIYNLDTGQERLTSQTPVKRPLGSSGKIAVQRCSDRYIVIAGVTSKSSVRPLDSTLGKDFGTPSIESFSLDGHVVAVDLSSGRVLWSLPVLNTAFDPTQSPKLPVLVLAAKLSEREIFQRISRVTVLILDKRTGTTIFEKEETMSPPIGRGVQFVPMIEEQKLIIDFTSWKIELTFPLEK